MTLSRNDSVLSKLSQIMTFWVIDVDLDDQDIETYRDLGTPILNMIWMRNWPVFNKKSRLQNKIYTIIHRIGRYGTSTLLTMILVILRLFIPLWFMFMLFAHYFSEDHEHSQTLSEETESYSAFKKFGPTKFGNFWISEPDQNFWTHCTIKTFTRSTKCPG